MRSEERYRAICDLSHSKFNQWEINMWWNDSYMPEYIFSNHEAYIGDTAPKVAVEIASLIGYICIGGIFLTILNYYYSMDYISKFTYTKVRFADLYENSKRLTTEKVGLQKDFMGSGKRDLFRRNFDSLDLTGKNYTQYRDYSSGSGEFVDSGYQSTVKKVQDIMSETNRYFTLAETQALEQATKEWEQAQNHQHH